MRGCVVYMVCVLCLGVPHERPVGGLAHALRGEQAQRARVGAVLGEVDALGERLHRVVLEHGHALLRDDGPGVHALLETFR